MPRPYVRCPCRYDNDLADSSFKTKICVELDGLIQLDGPGLGVGFRVVDDDFDFKVPEVHTPEAFGDLHGVR